MNQTTSVKKSKITDKEIRKIEKQIKSASYLLVKDYFGEQINEVDSKDKKRINEKISKTIRGRIHQKYKISHIKNISYMDFVDVMMFISDITFDDIKHYL